MPKARISVRAAPRIGAEPPALVGRALRLGSQELPLYSGAVHYFRLQPSAWRPALEGLKSLGLNLVETYIPWGVHELRDGSYDFGQYDPQKDLGAFLDLAHKLGLYAFVRPGPNINAELTYFGLPRRIVFDEACQARSSRGRPLTFVAPPRMFPVPSFASEHFFQETDRWYAEAAKIVAPRVWPNGPVVLMQVDNEAAFYFRDAPYDQDHHPDALTKYVDFLRERHGALEDLNAAHAMAYESWDEVLPPARCDPDASYPALRRSLDLMHFQEELLAGAIERLQKSLRAHFGELPAVHNVPLGDAGLPVGLARLDRVVDVNGLDYYHRARYLNVVRERTLRLVGSVRFPYAPELGLGAPPWFAARSEEDSLQTLLCACAYGIRGLNLYMAVDRDRWYGAPFDELGRERPHAGPIRRVLAALQRAQFHTLTRRIEVGIMLPREYARLSRATHTLGAISPTLLDMAGAGANAACLQTPFGFAAPIQIVWSDFVERFAEVLTRAQVPYVYVESDVDESQWSGLRVLISPTYEFADPTRLARLQSFAERGGTVICGPRLPYLDDQLRQRPAEAQARVRRAAVEYAPRDPNSTFPGSLETRRTAVDDPKRARRKTVDSARDALRAAPGAASEPERPAFEHPSDAPHPNPDAQPSHPLPSQTLHTPHPVSEGDPSSTRAHIDDGVPHARPNSDDDPSLTRAHSSDDPSRARTYSDDDPSNACAHSDDDPSNARAPSNDDPSNALAHADDDLSHALPSSGRDPSEAVRAAFEDPSRAMRAALEEPSRTLRAAAFDNPARALRAASEDASRALRDAFEGPSRGVRGGASSGGFRLCEARDAERVVDALTAELNLASPFAALPPGIQTAVHEDDSGPRVLFVLQPEEATVEVEILLPEPFALIDVLTAERYEGRTSTTIPMPGYSCRMFQCERLPAPTPRPRAPSARRSTPPC